MPQQFKAGYISDSIASILNEKKLKLDKKDHNELIELNKINGLLQYVSSFDVQFPYEHNLDYQNLNPVLSTINNIVTRGLPTKAPKYIEEKFVEIGLIEENKKDYEFEYPKSIKKISFETIFELLHIIKPGLNISRDAYGGKPEGGEWDFLDKRLADFPFAKQILQSQRDFSTIAPKMVGGKRVDFSFEYPYNLSETNSNDKLEINRKKGIILEFDGPHHYKSDYQIYDKYRDDIAENKNFKTLRQAYYKRSLNQQIKNLFEDDEIFKIFAENYNQDIKDYLIEYTLLFVPLAVARVQKTIIEYLLAHKKLLKQQTIKIAIIERDFPCGALAVEGLKDIFSNLNAILEDDSKLRLREIDLSIYENKDFVYNSKLHLGYTPQSENHFIQNKFDIIIDHSILIRSNIYKEKTFVSDNSVIVRSSHYFDTTFGNTRRVYCANLLNYKKLVEKQDDGSYKAIPEIEKHITYFIQNIFRKKEFREGQLPIISRALQQKPVLGLLPTGGGKSLTYQLPALMQPGICLIVDPIKSLMEDQTRVLKNNLIDTCNYINSNLERKEKVKRLIDFRYGETQFLFVSPERFVMKDFRDIIQNLDWDYFGLAISYCVIDEVHCVSEWGHDFRFTYLMLGKNSQRFTKTKNKKPVSLIGLTATASFDVLADIERELQIQRDDVANAIIMIENTIRPELFFRVIDVTDKDRISELNKDFENVGKNLKKINNKELIRQSLEHHYSEFEQIDETNKLYKEIYDENGNEKKIRDSYVDKFILKEKDINKEIETDEPANLDNKTQDDFYSIIFCPVRGQGGNKLGVNYVFENIQSSSQVYFYSCDEEAKDIKKCEEEVKRNFEEFITDKKKHMVCTKAFGMGIDKADIRFTYHYLYSSSFESLVQEAGRSGRDKKISEANILISTEKYYYFDIFTFFSENFEDNLIRKGRVRKSIRNALQRKFILMPDNTWKIEEIIFPTIEELLKSIDTLDLSFIMLKGAEDIEKTDKLRILMKTKDKQENYLYIHENYKDRRIHDYFYQNSFKGIDIEKAQLKDLFYDREFQITADGMVFINGQDCLANEIMKCDKQVEFYITATKEYINLHIKICKLLNINPEDAAPTGIGKTKAERVNEAINYSKNFYDFLFYLNEYGLKNLDNIDDETMEKLKDLYYKERISENDTGRLIYRMHSMGFLTDYIIDYNKKRYKCTFAKRANIEKYVEIIKEYLPKYLSEQSAIAEIEKLRKRLNKDTLIDNILECLYFLSEFSYKEIAEKRRRATDEIEKELNICVRDSKYSGEENWFKQNKYLKEQIYYYFNAKYARIDFKINNEPYSLSEDYKNKQLNRIEILEKYLNAIKLEGTEQNNYKHMIGSCKKIMRTLATSDIKREWLLRLLKAFSMYAVNNPSYINDATDEVEKAFNVIYSVFENDYESIQKIFEIFFGKLIENIKPDNISYKIIKQIRLKLLLDFQVKSLTKMVNKF